MRWIIRMAAAGIGTWLYYRLNAPNWHNRYNLLYDIPMLPIALACSGESLSCCWNAPCAGTGLRILAQLMALGAGYGAQYRSWPISGHLTMATTVAILTLTKSGSPWFWKLLALLPVILLILIRSLRPQNVLMGNACNTLLGILLGSLLGGMSLLVTDALTTGG